MEEARLRRDPAEALGGQVFGWLVSLLRPVVRRRRRTEPATPDAAAALPPQRIDFRLQQTRGHGSAEVVLWLRCPVAEPLVLAWTLPLPPVAAVGGLDLQCAGGREPAGLCERRQAREWFDVAGRAGLPGALLAEDAPGVFGLEIATPGCGALRLGLHFAWMAGDAEEVELSLRCEAGAAPRQGTPRSRLLRLGASRRLDRLVGILADERAQGGYGAADIPPGAAPRAATTPSALLAHERSSPDVFASCDRAGGSRAMYRGSLGARPVRLWAELRAPSAAATQTAPPAPAAPAAPVAAQIDRLMAEYRRADRNEAERRSLADAVARLGLEAGVATLWTSFVAVVGARDPGGEIVFAAA